MSAKQNSKYRIKYHRKFCPAICSIGLITVCYQLPLHFVLVDLYLRLYLVLLCLCLIHTITDLRDQW
jgi:hypothetical protein